MKGRRLPRCWKNDGTDFVRVSGLIDGSRNHEKGEALDFIVCEGQVSRLIALGAGGEVDGTKEWNMKKAIRNLANRAPMIRRLNEQVDELKRREGSLSKKLEKLKEREKGLQLQVEELEVRSGGLNAQNESLNGLAESLRQRAEGLDGQVKKQGAFPAGHYYSPIPSEHDILGYEDTRKTLGNGVLGVELNEEHQHGVLNEYCAFYQDLPFPEEQTPGHRYYYKNGWFSYSDAIFLYSFLRKHAPRRIIEIGSGFSSAVMLDTIDRFLPERPELTFVEPEPERLLSLLREDEGKEIGLVEKRVHDVSLEDFSALESGDLLFIDSSHVVKCGSDVELIFSEILPSLRPGVFVHFHDVFYPFVYPVNWLNEGRYWNENYFLRAFLSYNAEWSIEFFNTFVHLKFGDLIAEKMPLCVKNPGGSLYIRRKLES